MNYITSRVSVTITCGIQPTNVVTMAMEALCNSCNMCTLDVTDMHALTLSTVALFLMHTCQLSHLYTCNNYVQHNLVTILAPMHPYAF